MAARISPTVRARRLRTALRQLRERTGLTLDEVSERCEGDIAPNTVSRYETGERRITPASLRMLLDVYGVTGDEREALRELAKQAQERGWWQQYAADMAPGFPLYVGLESEASVLRGYETELVPGILQTDDYYRSFLRAAPAAGDPEAIERKVAVRAERQQRLEGDDPPDIWVVLNEAVICRVVGDAKVMRDQLLHVAALTERPGITIQVLKFSAGAHQAMEGPFMVLGFPDEIDRDVAYIEYQMGSLIIEGLPEVERFTAMFSHLAAQALGPGESAALIADTAAKLV